MKKSTPIYTFFISNNIQVIGSRVEPGLSDPKTYALFSPCKLCYGFSNHLEQKTYYSVRGY